MKRAGNVLQVVSAVNDDQRIGIGIGYRDGLAVVFDDKAGKLLQVFKVDGDGLIGFGQMMGTNKWVPSAGCAGRNKGHGVILRNVRRRAQRVLLLDQW